MGGIIMPRTGMTGQLPFIELRDSKVEGNIAVLTLEATDSSEHIIRVGIQRSSVFIFRNMALSLFLT